MATDAHDFYRALDQLRNQTKANVERSLALIERAEDTMQKTVQVIHHSQALLTSLQEQHGRGRWLH